MIISLKKLRNRRVNYLTTIKIFEDDNEFIVGFNFFHDHSHDVKYIRIIDDSINYINVSNLGYIEINSDDIFKYIKRKNGIISYRHRTLMIDHKEVAKFIKQVLETYPIDRKEIDSIDVFYRINSLLSSK